MTGSGHEAMRPRMTETPARVQQDTPDPHRARAGPTNNRVAGGHVALWSRRRSGTISIVDATGHVVASYLVPQAADRPGAEMLWGTGWSDCPGSEWREEFPGQWLIAVFRHPERGS